MSIEIRNERIGDEDAIDLVNCTAFGSMDEANIVQLMRLYSPAYDRRYSVVAWDGDEPVGHTLFTPAALRLMGQTVPALAVGPVAVRPEWRRKGIGGDMLSLGHELGRREGFAFAFLYGIPDYYPRVGYRACYGVAKVTIDVDKLPKATMSFQNRPVLAADIPWLVERWRIEWADVDFGWLWGSSRHEWHIPGMNARMWWTADGRRAAYTMDKAGRGRCKVMLADDPELARQVLATMRPKTLEHHPSGWLAQHALQTEWAACKAERITAAMACELQPGALDPYIKALEAGERLPGFTMFPLPFLAC